VLALVSLTAARSHIRKPLREHQVSGGVRRPGENKQSNVIHMVLFLLLMLANHRGACQPSRHLATLSFDAQVPYSYSICPTLPQAQAAAVTASLYLLSLIVPHNR